MNKRIIVAAALASAITGFAKGSTDPVLMTVNGIDVPLSEFEYLYNKNNAQQLEPMSFDQYVEMFVDYKLKVADAIAAGVDTTETFRKEYEKFRYELAEPFMTDSAVAEQLVLDVYERYGQEVLVSHIMLPPMSQRGLDGKEKADSIRTAILNGEISFEDAAAKYSIDRASKYRGGVMGWLSANGRAPWAFEQAAYDTPVGELSKVIDSGYGFHIVKPVQRRKSPGEVSSQHILILTQGKTPQEAAAAKERIDSLYKVVTTQGVDFGDIARKYSEDPGSAKRGGDLGWYGAGRMVAEFDSVSFALPVGAISEPFATSYGYHIVHKTGHRDTPIPSLDEARESIQNAIDNDSRKSLPVQATLDRIAAATNSQLYDNITAKVAKHLADKGYSITDSAAIAMICSCQEPAFVVDGKMRTVGQCVPGNSPLHAGMDVNSAAILVGNMCTTAYHEALKDLKIADLEKNNAEFRNLSKEYRDGIMLFDIANKKVWEKASKDTEGQQAYFQAHKDKYVWDAPKYKAYIVQCTNDSIRRSAEEYLKGIDPTTVTSAQLTADLKERYGKSIRVDRVIAAKGENAITDYLAFGGEKPEVKPTQRMKYFFAYDGKILDQPSELEDVKGQVINDYQSSLEKEWLNQLHKKYKVKINKKVLNQAK